MKPVMKSEAQSNRWFTHQILPLALAGGGVLLAFWIQDVPLFQRHAPLLALLVGIAFFHPPTREVLLITFCYGFGFYVWIRCGIDVTRWSHVSSVGQARVILWIPVGLFCFLAAASFGMNAPRSRVSAFAFLALATYFVSYTYAEASAENWLRAMAGAGFALIGYWAALNSFREQDSPVAK